LAQGPLRLLLHWPRRLAGPPPPGAMAGFMAGSFDLSSVGALHDVQMNYYGQRVAGAAGDNSVHVWDVTESQPKQVGLLQGHEGPVWKVSWAHPKFGTVLATCGYDMKVIIWKEERMQWQMAYMDTSHVASVNDVAFCPWEHGLRLACASSDGTVSVLTHSAQDQQWRRAVFSAHAGGAQTVSWAPVQHKENPMAPVMRLATGGCDNSVCVWKCEGEVWTQESPPLPSVHRDWIRSVAWRPDGASVLASGSWDKTVIVWSQEMEGQPWRQVCKLPVAGKVECLSWSCMGNILAVSFGDSETVLYKEALDGHFEEIGKVSEQGYTELGNRPVVGAGACGLDGGAADATSPPTASLSNELAMQQQAVLDSFGMT